VEGVKLFLRGERCYKDKCAINKRNVPPGKAASKMRRRRKLSQYGQQQREKQKVKRTYGVLERQFRRYYQMAARSKEVTGPKLLELLERRLDNVAYRLGFASGRAAARQLVRHGHVMVNGRKVDIPSYQVAASDVVEVREAKRNLAVVKNAISLRRQRGIVNWLELEADKPLGKVIRLPQRTDIDLEVKEHLIVELYSK